MITQESELTSSTFFLWFGNWSAVKWLSTEDFIVLFTCCCKWILCHNRYNSNDFNLPFLSKIQRGILSMKRAICSLLNSFWFKNNEDQNWLKIGTPQKTFVGLQESLKTSSRHISKALSTRLQLNNFSSLNTSKDMSSRHLGDKQNVYWWYMCPANLCFTNLYLPNLRRIENPLITTKKFRHLSYCETHAAFLF